MRFEVAGMSMHAGSVVLSLAWHLLFQIHGLGTTIHKWKHGCYQRASIPCWVMGLGVPSVVMHDLAPVRLRVYSRAFFRLIVLSLCLLLTGFVKT